MDKSQRQVLVAKASKTVPELYKYAESRLKGVSDINSSAFKKDPTSFIAAAYNNASLYQAMRGLINVFVEGL